MVLLNPRWGTARAWGSVWEPPCPHRDLHPMPALPHAEPAESSVSLVCSKSGQHLHGRVPGRSSYSVLSCYRQMPARLFPSGTRELARELSHAEPGTSVQDAVGLGGNSLQLTVSQASPRSLGVHPARARGHEWLDLRSACRPLQAQNPL
jgi:hypothetical protein